MPSAGVECPYPNDLTGHISMKIAPDVPDMTTVVEAHLPAERFALDEALGAVPDLAVEVVRTAGSGTAESPLPYIRVSTDADVDLQETLASDPTTERVEALDGLRHASLFRVEWASGVRIALHCLSMQAATILDARATNGEWRFQLLFPERDGVRTAFDASEEFDVNLQLERISSENEPIRDRRSEITGLQLETIRQAYESGYYEVPRGTSLVDLATRIGVSHQALSERIRRGHAALVEDSLARQTS